MRKTSFFWIAGAAITSAAVGWGTHHSGVWTLPFLKKNEKHHCVGQSQCSFTPQKQDSLKGLSVSQQKERKRHQYIQDHIFGSQASFAFWHGPLPATPFCVVIFTSLTCQVCRDMHLSYLKAINKMDLFKKMRISVMFVEYPAEPLSLYAAGYLWQQNAEKLGMKLLEIHQHIFQIQDQWMKPDLQASLSALKKALHKKFGLPIAENDQKTLENIFASKMAAKEAFDIEQIPYCVILRKKNEAAGWDQGFSIVTTMEGDTGLKSFLSWIRKAVSPGNKAGR